MTANGDEHDNEPRGRKLSFDDLEGETPEEAPRASFSAPTSEGEKARAPRPASDEPDAPRGDASRPDVARAEDREAPAPSRAVSGATSTRPTDQGDAASPVSDEEWDLPAAAGSERAGGGHRRRLLVVSYYYPPLGLDRVVRIAKFTKYLPQQGWEPTVLTVGEIGYYAFDYSLLEEVFEAGVVIERTKAMDLLRLLRKRGQIKPPSDAMRKLVNRVTSTVLQPDGKIGWRRHAVKRALDVAAQEGFDAIFATAPPFTDFVVARDIQQKLGIPLVLDYREPWLDGRDAHFLTPFHKGISARMEEEVLKSAESVVVANRKIKEKLIARYTFLTHESVHIIPTGYDPQDFHVASRLTQQRSRKMRITHAGMFDPLSSPKPFFQALATIFARHPEVRDEIEALFVGPIQEAHRKLAVTLGVSSALVTPGHVEHHEIARHLLSSDLLWLQAGDPALVPDSLYQYIATGRPILAIVPDGIIRQMLTPYRAADTIDASDPGAIADAIYERYQQWRAGELPKGDPRLAREYDQRRLAERLARVLAYSMKIF